MKYTLYLRLIAHSIILLLLPYIGLAQVVSNGCIDGTVSPGQSVCPGTQPGDLTLSANTGTVIKWQSSPTPDFSAVTDINVISSVLGGDDMGTIISTTYFRAVLQSDVCNFAASAYAMVTVKAVAPNPGSLSRFALFTATGAVSNTGITQIGGDVATHAGEITGFEAPSVITGTTQNANAATAQAKEDIIALYGALYSIPATNSTHTPAFGNGETMFGGVYSIGGAASVAGNLTLDALGDPDRIFIFRAQGAFTTDAGTTVILANGAVAANVFWVADGAITIGAATGMKGILVANGAISLGTESILNGNMYSKGGILYTHANTVTPAAPTGGIISGGATVCLNENTAVLTLTGYTGSIVKWQSSTVSDFSVNITDIPNTSATLTAPLITQSTWFRAVIDGTGCTQEHYSEPAALIVNVTVWNGTAWSNGIPTFDYSAVINGDYNSSVNGEITACSLTINSGNVMVATTDTFTIKSVITVNGGMFTIEDNGSLIQKDNVGNEGNITVRKNSNLLYREDYTLWSSPVAGQNLQAFSPATLPNRFYTYGTGTNGTEAYLPVNASGNFAEAKGYLIRMPNQITGAGASTYIAGTSSYMHTGTFTGVPHNGTVQVPMSVSNNYYTLVGNPYPSPVNVADLFAGNAAVMSPVHGIYFWRKKNNDEATTYATLNTVAYTANDGGVIDNTQGQYNNVNNYGGQQWENYYSTTPPAAWTIATGQGFFVAGDGSGGNFVFTNMMRSAASSGQPFFRTAPQAEPAVSRLWLNLNSATNFSQIAIAYTPNATDGLDFGMDSRQFSNASLSLYSLAANEKLAIQSRPAFEASDSVPIGFSTFAGGAYSISLHRRDGLFVLGQQVYLKDNLLNVVHDFATGAYPLTTDAGIHNGRFEVVYADNALGTATASRYTNSIIVYKDGHDLHVDGGKEVLASVKIFDVSGRLIYLKDQIKSFNTIISGIQAAQQVLVVQATTTDGVIISRKIVF
jgi:hypothetical protein